MIAKIPLGYNEVMSFEILKFSLSNCRLVRTNFKTEHLPRSYQLVKTIGQLPVPPTFVPRRPTNSRTPGRSVNLLTRVSWGTQLTTLKA